MSIPLTPARLRALYECLRQFPPFNKMGLPPADEIQFEVTKTRAVSGAYCRYTYTDHHIIEVSQACNGHFATAAATMAHEMIHLGQHVQRTTTPNTEHNADFHRIAKLVCKRFGWDPKTF